jgi:photosystem II stability/assembly factor-like uncharacterized protein
MARSLLAARGAALACAAGVTLAAQSPGTPTPTVDSVTFGDITARAIGPATTSGRITSLDASADDPRTLYAGTAGGGVWKSTNGGATFRPVFDDHVMSIGAVTIDQSKPDIVWVGTGESWVRNSVSVGRGVFKTTDGGKTWQAVGLENTERIARIIVHPRRSDTVYACALGHLWNANDDRGVYKTADGGKTWARLLFVDANTGCADLEIDPQEPDTLYSAMWQVRRLPYFFTSGGAGSGLYKSTDGGSNWTRISKGLPEGELGRIGLAVARSRPTTLYASVEAKQTAIYRSDDAGESWRATTAGEQPFFVRARPFYFSNIEVDPVDHQRLYVPGLFLTVSSTGGRAFELTSFGGGVHPDHHALWINPEDPTHLVLGTDGGVYVSRDKGAAFVFSTSLPVAQFYHVSVDMQRPYRVYGGLQDNGSWSAPSRALGASAIRSREWRNVGIGDGFHVFPDPRDPAIIFSEYQGGQVRRLQVQTGEMKDIRPRAGKEDPPYRFNWNAAFAPGVHDPGVLYLGAQFLFRSRDRGDTWERVSPDLTTDDPAKQRQKESGGLTRDNTTAENHCTIVAVAESPLERGVIWVGTDDGNVQISRDDGRTWQNVVKNVPGVPPHTWVSMIEAGRHRAGVAYVTFDGHRTGDMKPYAYITEDYGQSWRPIANGLDGYVHAIRQDLASPGLLFAGTEFGLFISIDHGESWSRMTRLPRVAVHDLVIHPREHDLVLATHGRGVQIVDDITPLRALSPEVLAKNVAVLPSRPAAQRVPAVLQDFPGDQDFAAPNPPDGAYVTYYLKSRHIFGKLTVEILDAGGRVVQVLPAGARQGINRVLWNMRLPPPRSAAAPGLGARALAGPMVPEGTYTVRVTRGDDVATGTIELQPDPLAAHPPEARQRRQVLLMRLYEAQAELAYVADAAARLRDDLRARSAALHQRRGTASRVSSEASALADELDKVHSTLVDRAGGLMAADPQLRERVIDLYGSVLSYGGAPTGSQADYVEVLMGELSQKRQAIAAMTGSRLEALNVRIKQAGEPPALLPSREEFEKKR